MGTRGAIGFRINEEDKISYNHSDSYPTSLGVKVMEFVKATPDEDMRKMAKRIKMVKQDKKPTKKQIQTCMKAGVVNLGVSEGSEQDWYCLLRNAQGDLGAYARGYMIDSHRFLKDSLFCEWGFILNVDTKELEIYRGFNKTAGGPGRYAGGEPDQGYYGVSLFRVLPFKAIRELEDIDKYCENMEASVPVEA